MMRALVTGGRGFIGSHLVRNLIALGIDVAAPAHEEMDITDAVSVATYFGSYKPEWVFNLAGYRGDDGDEAERVNVKGTEYLLRAAEETGVNAFIQSSSCMEYGDSAVPFREDTPTRPVGVYAVSKLRASELVLMSTVPSAVLRCSNVYGPGSTRDLFHLIRVALKTGDRVRGTQAIQRDYVYVDDVVAAYIRAAEHILSIRGQVINIGSNTEHSTVDVIRHIEKLLGMHSGTLLSRDPYVPHEYQQRSNRVDSSNAERLLGWKPRVSFDVGVAHALAR
jgi:nucleoside-diphosphate-sugar epimerase